MLAGSSWRLLSGSPILDARKTCFVHLTAPEPRVADFASILGMKGMERDGRQQARVKFYENRFAGFGGAELRVQPGRLDTWRGRDDCIFPRRWRYGR